LTEVRLPSGVRVDGWVETGTEVIAWHDPMLAKIIVTGADRPAAPAALRAALDRTAFWGGETNLGYSRAIAASDMLARGDACTGALGAFPFAPDLLEVLSPGAQTSVQDLPGRLGMWHVGVPPSGPMDARSFVHANRLAGNGDETAALELTVSGPALRFHAEAVVALAGARMPMKSDGAPAPHGAAVRVPAGAALCIGVIEGPGQRAYLALRGGIAAPVVLGSRATFGPGRSGGHAAGVVATGATQHLARAPQDPRAPGAAPSLTREWEIAVLYGPHGAPDFFT
jgi:urea carboxylase